MANWMFRRSFKIAPGVRINVGKRSVGISAGVKGFHVGVGSRGPYTSMGIPGTGLYGMAYLGKGSGRRSPGGSAQRRRSRAEAPDVLASESPEEAAAATQDTIRGMPSGALRRVVRENFPDFAEPRLPLAVPAIAVGILALIATAWWGALLVAYGIVARVRNARGTRRIRESLLTFVDEGLATDRQNIEADRHRSKAWTDMGGMPEGPTYAAADRVARQAGVLLGAKEKPRWSVEEAVLVHLLGSAFTTAAAIRLARAES